MNGDDMQSASAQITIGSRNAIARVEWWPQGDELERLIGYGRPLVAVGEARRNTREDSPDPRVAELLATGRAFEALGRKLTRQGRGLVKHNDDERARRRQRVLRQQGGGGRQCTAIAHSTGVRCRRQIRIGSESPYCGRHGG